MKICQVEALLRHEGRQTGAEMTKPVGAFRWLCKRAYKRITFNGHFTTDMSGTASSVFIILPHLPSPTQIMINQTQFENVVYFTNLGSMITKWCKMYTWNQIQECHNKNCIQQKDSFHQQTGLVFKEETSKCYVWSIGLCGAETSDTSEIRSETPGKFWNVVLEKDGEDQLDRSCDRWSSIT
jgi:hypothetical protein